jgi:hypothetical protein
MMTSQLTQIQLVRTGYPAIPGARPTEPPVHVSVDQQQGLQITASATPGVTWPRKSCGQDSPVSAHVITFGCRSEAPLPEEARPGLQSFSQFGLSI